MSLTLNPFDLLGDEGDGGRRRRVPVPKPAAPAPTPAVTAKPAAAPATKPAPQQQPADNKKASNAKAATPNAAPAKKENGAPKSKPQQGGDAQKNKGERRAPQQGGAPPAPRTTGDEGAAGQGKQNWHGERRERAPGRGRKFDRRSGTGRPPTENKRSGSGKANWGKLGEGEEEVAKENGEVEKEDTEKPAEGEAAPAAEGEVAPKEPELKSLDEYLEEKKKKAAKVDAPKVRTAGEGVDQSAWKEYVPLSKEDGGEVGPLKNKKKDAAPKEGAAKDAASTEILNFHLAPPAGVEERGRGRGGRGGRSGDRKVRGDRGGRGGRQGGRGRQQDGSSVSFGAEDFPVLGGSGGVPAAKPAAAPAPAAAAPAPVKA